MEKFKHILDHPYFLALFSSKKIHCHVTALITSSNIDVTFPNASNYGGNLLRVLNICLVAYTVRQKGFIFHLLSRENTSEGGQSQKFYHQFIT